MSSEELPNSALTATLDLQMLKHLEKIIGQEMLQLLIEQFIDYAPQQLQALQNSLKNNDFQSLSQQAHQFKGESLQIGANEVGSLCNQLERLAQTEQLEAASAYLVKLKIEWLHLKKALSQVNNHD